MKPAPNHFPSWNIFLRQQSLRNRWLPHGEWTGRRHNQSRRIGLFFRRKARKEIEFRLDASRELGKRCQFEYWVCSWMRKKEIPKTKVPVNQELLQWITPRWYHHQRYTNINNNEVGAILIHGTHRREYPFYSWPTSTGKISRSRIWCSVRKMTREIIRCLTPSTASDWKIISWIRNWK